MMTRRSRASDGADVFDHPRNRADGRRRHHAHRTSASAPSALWRCRAKKSPPRNNKLQTLKFTPGCHMTMKYPEGERGFIRYQISDPQFFWFSGFRENTASDSASGEMMTFNTRFQISIFLVFRFSRKQ
jgi:hypothetical protein